MDNKRTLSYYWKAIVLRVRYSRKQRPTKMYLERIEDDEGKQDNIKD